MSLSSDTSGRRVPNAWVRARGRVNLEDPLQSWSAAIGLTLLALVLRLWHLGTPKEFAFDETYYAKDAWSLANHGYVLNYSENANQQILNGHVMGNWQSTPSMIVHPEVGKWLIALGEKTFGMDPTGWRVASAVVGSLMVLVMCRLARRMTGSTMLGLVAGFLLMFDGLHFVLSRLALLDIFVAFFLLCAVTCMVVDRDWYRAKMARLVPDQITDPYDWGPVRQLLWRPWLVLSGVCWGLAVGTKWTALYPLAAFGVLVWLWSAGARRSFGVRLAVLRSVLADGVPAAVSLLLVGLVVYTLTWTGWLVHASEYEEHRSSTQYTQFIEERPCKNGSENNLDNSGARWSTATEPDATGPAELVQSLKSLAYYHRDVYRFHTHFLNCSEHSYGSKPSGWLLINRPVSVSVELDIQPGTRGCDAPAGSECIRHLVLIGTPVIWWAGIIALLFSAVMWVGARDWRFGVVVVGVLSGWLPWLQYDDRPIYYFYAIVFLPFLVLGLTLAIGKLIGSARDPSPRRTLGVVAAGSFLVLALLNFAWFYPVLTYQLLTRAEWLDRMWFSNWI